MKFPRKEQNRILQCQVRLAGRHPLPLGIVTHTQSFKYLLHISAFHTDSSSSDLSSELLTHVLSSTCLTKYVELNSINTKPMISHLQYDSLLLSSMKISPFNYCAHQKPWSDPGFFLSLTFTPRLSQRLNHLTSYIIPPFFISTVITLCKAANVSSLIPAITYSVTFPNSPLCHV